MGSAIELYEARKVELSYLQTVGEVLAKSHFFDDAQTAERAVAKILAGQEFGMGALESMRSFHVIDGKVEMSADAQARLVKAHPSYDYIVASISDAECEIRFFDYDGNGMDVPIGISTFTIEDARKAGIVKKDGAWEKYPRNMLFARALTNGVAWFCPDAISGGRVYAPGEISGEAWVEASSVVEPVAGSPGGSAVDSNDADDGKATEDEAGEVLGEDASPASDVEPEASVDEPAASDGGGEIGGSQGRDSADPPLLSSQSKQLLRHAVDLRWNDLDIAAAVDEAYPGITAISALSQEQARALIPEWARLVKATRPTKEQKDRLKSLATPQDAARRAQVMFGADHIRNVGDLTLAEAAALISDLEGAA